MAEQFELVSRGDFVPGRLWRGHGADRTAAVLLAPSLGAGKEAAAVTAWCRAIAGAGLTVAVIDLPLQGERESAKLTRRLLACAGDPARDAQLWSAYERQLGSDLDSALAWLARHEAIRPDALGLLALEPGAAAALAWAATRDGLRVSLAASATAEPSAVVATLREQLS